MELRILIRQLPIYNNNLQQIYYSGTSPINLVVAVGPLPAARQWPTYPNFIDITDEAGDLQKTKLSWSIQRDNGGVVTPGNNNIKKGVSGNVEIEGDAYALIKSWLIDDVSAPINGVEVKFLDTNCGYYENFVIKPSELQWCENDICKFDVNVKQSDEQLNCIKRTMISDNWQGWFPTNGKPLNGKKHPRFAYCKEQRPNGIMIMVWWLMINFMGPIAMVMVVILSIIALIALILNAIISVINSIPGVSMGYVNVPNPLAVFDAMDVYIVESAGCGREHPAPLIRDYITNVCDKCGITVDAVTAPIFFATVMNIETSSRGVISAKNPHYNACYFFPQTKRGIRRYDSVNFLGGSPMNTTEYWIDDNRPLLTLDMFLDKLKGPYNAEWRIKANKLYFQRKDYYLAGNYIYDFTANSADRLKILEGICFEPNEIKFPAYCKGLWQTDAADTSEAGGINGTGQMNGIVQFGNIDDNPNFEGAMDKTCEFGSTKFNLDGASGCYYFDGLQQMINTSIWNPISWFSIGQAAASLHDYGDYAILMQSEVCTQPKIIIWNGLAYLNARAISTKAAVDNIAPEPMPDINPAYNLTPELWKVRHAPITKVIGSATFSSTAPMGIYKVASPITSTPIAEKAAKLINYPMYFEPYYYDTMWDWFHWIDDPKRNPSRNINWRLKIDLCCDDLNLLGVLGDASNIALGERIKIPLGYFQDGILKEIEVSYDNEDVYGKYIELKGQA